MPFILFENLPCKETEAPAIDGDRDEKKHQKTQPQSAN